MSAESPRQNFFDLLSQLYDAEFSPEGEQTLSTLVLGDVELRRAYLRYAMLHACLHEGAAKPQAVAMRSPVLTKLLSAVQPLRRPLVGSTLAIAAMFYGIFILLAWNLHPDAGRNFAQHEAETGQQPLATITATDECQWSQEKRLGDALYAEEIGLLSGVAEITFADGAQVAVKGPADFSLTASDRGYLHRGHLVANVPRQAVGFTIETPTAEIVDLGTEFGVDVDATGRTDVQVLEGAVNVDYSSLDDKSKLSRRSVRMTAGSAKRFSAQQGATDVVTATEIAPWLDKAVGTTKPMSQQQTPPAETRYAAAVLADRPLGYWRFSDPDSHRATDASGHGNHGEYVGFVSTKNPGICPDTRDRSIQFLGKAYGGHVRINDFELPASCTVELWARSATPAWNDYGWLLSCAVANGVQLNPSGEGRAWHGYFHNAGNEAPMLGPHEGPTDIADRFHQYVISYDSATDRGAMYCDGILVGETADLFGANPRREPARLTLYVGCVDPRTPTPRWGEGFVDELAIYGDVLTPDAVKRHYEAAGYSTPKNSKP